MVAARPSSPAIVGSRGIKYRGAKVVFVLMVIMVIGGRGAGEAAETPKAGLVEPGAWFYPLMRRGCRRGHFRRAAASNLARSFATTRGVQSKVRLPT